MSHRDQIAVYAEEEHGSCFARELTLFALIILSLGAIIVFHLRQSPATTETRVIATRQTTNGQPFILGSKNWCESIANGGALLGQVKFTRSVGAGSPYQGLFQTADLNGGVRLEVDDSDAVSLISPTNIPTEYRSVQIAADEDSSNEVSFEVTAQQLLLSRGNVTVSLGGTFSPSCSTVIFGRGFDSSRSFAGDTTSQLALRTIHQRAENKGVITFLYLLASALFILFTTSVGFARKSNQLKLSRPRRFTILVAIAGSSLALVPLMLTTLGRVWTFSNGWFMTWQDEATHRRIYDSFLFPLPPLALIEGLVPNLFSQIFMAEQIYHFVIWTVFCVTSFLVARRFCDLRRALFLTAVLCSTYFGMPYNFIVGYFELAVLLLVLGALALPSTMDVSGTSNSIRIALSGACVASSALVKQPFATGAVVVGVFGLFYFRRLRERRRFALWFSIGVLIPVVPVVIYVGFKTSYSNFLNQMLSGGGKGDVTASSLQRVFDWGFIRAIAPSQLEVWIWLIPLLALGLVSLGADNSKPVAVDTNDKHNTILSRRLKETAAIALITGLSLGILDQLIADDATFVGQAIKLVTLTIGAALLVNVYLDPMDAPIEPVQCLRKKREIFCLICIVAGVAYGVVATALGNPTNFFVDNEIGTRSSTLLATIGSSSALLLILLGLVLSAGSRIPALCLIKKVVSGLWLEQFSGLQVQSLLLVALVIPVVNSLSGWTTYESWHFFLLIFIAVVLNKIKQKGVVLLPICALMILAGVDRSYSNPYDWWGLRVPPLDTPRAKVNSTALAGFLLDFETASYIHRIQGISKQVEVNVERPRALYGPQNAGLQYVLGVKQMELQCSILWWDVCSLANQSLSISQITKTPPDMIVWNVPPDAVKAGHDFGFNSETSIISSMDRLLENLVKRGEYALRARLAVPWSNGWFTLVLQLKEEN